MDPLSNVLSLLEPRNYLSAGFAAGGDWAIQFPDQQGGIKTGAVVAGECWLSVEGAPDPVRLRTGDCFLLPNARPFRLASDMAMTPVDAGPVFSAPRKNGIASLNGGGDFLLVSNRFGLEGNHAGMLLGMLPPIVHIRDEPGQAALRSSIERMMQELRDPQPGGFLVVQHLAHMMLVQALRLHLSEGPRGGVGWFFALADKQMSAAMNAMHQDPAHRWTLQALEFCVEIQADGRHIADGISGAMAHGFGRRPAGEFQGSDFDHCAIARLRIRNGLQHGLQESHGLLATAIWPPAQCRAG
jgi:hypothetical protein